jgi:hypothetical protein
LILLQAAEYSFLLPSLGQNGNKFPFCSSLAKIKAPGAMHGAFLLRNEGDKNTEVTNVFKE